MQETFSPLRIRQHNFFSRGRIFPSLRKGCGGNDCIHGNVPAAGAANVSKAAAESENPHGRGRPSVRRQRIFAQRGQFGQLSPAPGDGADSGHERLACGGHEPVRHAGLLGLLGDRGLAGAGVVGLRRAAGAAPCPAHPGGTAADFSRHFRVPDGADRAAVPAGAAGHRAGAGLFPADCPRRRGGTAVPRGAGQAHRRHRLAGGRRGGAGAGAGFPDALSGIGLSRGGCAGSGQRFPRRGAWRVGAGSGAGDAHSHDGGAVSRGRDPHDSF